MRGLHFRGRHFPTIGLPQTHFPDAFEGRLTYAQREVKMWDGTSMSEGDGLGFPSSIDGEAVPAVGPGTWYPWGMTLEQACRYYWRVMQADAALTVGELRATVPAIEIPEAHRFEVGEGWVSAPVSVASYSGEISSWPALSDPSAAGSKLRRDYSYQVGNSAIALCPDDHVKALLQQKAGLTTVFELEGGGVDIGSISVWKNVNGDPPETDAFVVSYANVRSSFNPGFVSEPVFYVNGLYWFPTPWLELEAVASLSVGWSDSEGAPKAASSISRRTLVAGSNHTKSSASDDLPAPSVTFRLKFSDAPGDVIEGIPFCVMTGYDDRSLGGAQDKSIPAEAYLDGPIVLTIAVEKWFTYGGIYDESTGARA